MLLNPCDWLNMALHRQSLREKIKQWREHKLAHIEKEIQNEENQLRLEIGKWRLIQLELMPQLGDTVAALPLRDIHEEMLCLPSDFNDSRRTELKINHLEEVEMRLREGQAQDALRDLRITVRNLNTLTFQKQTEIRGQEANTRANDVINKFRTKRRLLVAKYNAARNAMIALGCTDTNEDDDFPPLTESDAVMKHSERSYELGDGKRLGGPLFTAGVGKKVILPNEPGRILSPIINTYMLINVVGSRRQPQRKTKENDKMKSGTHISLFVTAEYK